MSDKTPDQIWQSGVNDRIEKAEAEIAALEIKVDLVNRQLAEIMQALEGKQ